MKSTSAQLISFSSYSHKLICLKKKDSFFRVSREENHLIIMMLHVTATFFSAALKKIQHAACDVRLQFNCLHLQFITWEETFMYVDL